MSVDDGQDCIVPSNQQIDARHARSLGQLLGLSPELFGSGPLTLGEANQSGLQKRLTQGLAAHSLRGQPAHSSARRTHLVPVLRSGVAYQRSCGVKQSLGIRMTSSECQRFQQQGTCLCKLTSRVARGRQAHVGIAAFDALWLRIWSGPLRPV